MLINQITFLLIMVATIPMALTRPLFWIFWAIVSKIPLVGTALVYLLGIVWTVIYFCIYFSSSVYERVDLLRLPAGLVGSLFATLGSVIAYLFPEFSMSDDSAHKQVVCRVFPYTFSFAHMYAAVQHGVVPDALYKDHRALENTKNAKLILTQLSNANPLYKKYLHATLDWYMEKENK